MGRDREWLCSLLNEVICHRLRASQPNHCPTHLQPNKKKSICSPTIAPHTAPAQVPVKDRHRPYCICVCICISTEIYTCIYVYMRAHMCMLARANTHTLTHTHICVYIRTHMCVCIHIYTHMCVHTVYVYVYASLLRYTLVSM